MAEAYVEPPDGDGEGRFAAPSVPASPLFAHTLPTPAPAAATAGLSAEFLFERESLERTQVTLAAVLHDLNDFRVKAEGLDVSARRFLASVRGLMRAAGVEAAVGTPAFTAAAAAHESLLALLAATTTTHSETLLATLRRSALPAIESAHAAQRRAREVLQQRERLARESDALASTRSLTVVVKAMIAAGGHRAAAQAFVLAQEQAIVAMGHAQVAVRLALQRSLVSVSTLQASEVGELARVLMRAAEVLQPPPAAAAAASAAAASSAAVSSDLPPSPSSSSLSLSLLPAPLPAPPPAPPPLPPPLSLQRLLPHVAASPRPSGAGAGPSPLHLPSTPSSLSAAASVAAAMAAAAASTAGLSLSTNVVRLLHGFKVGCLRGEALQARVERVRCEVTGVFGVLAVTNFRVRFFGADFLLQQEQLHPHASAHHGAQEQQQLLLHPQPHPHHAHRPYPHQRAHAHLAAPHGEGHGDGAGASSPSPSPSPVPFAAAPFIDLGDAMPAEDDEDAFKGSAAAPSGGGGLGDEAGGNSGGSGGGGDESPGVGDEAEEAAIAARFLVGGPLHGTGEVGGRLRRRPAVLSIPLMAVCRMEHVGGPAGTLVLSTSDFRAHAFSFGAANGDVETLAARLAESLWIGEQAPAFPALFALELPPAPPPPMSAAPSLATPVHVHARTGTVDGWAVYSPQRERLRLAELSAAQPSVRAEQQQMQPPRFCLSRINEAFGLCPTYPAFLLLPSAVAEPIVRSAAKFRSKRRLPAISWFRGSVCLARASQPLTGVFNARSVDDERLCSALIAEPEDTAAALAALEASGAGGGSRSGGGSGGGGGGGGGGGALSQLAIFDARPRLNAVGNAAKGGGTEVMSNYPFATLDYLNIDNIHVVRDALAELRALLLRQERLVLQAALVQRLEQCRPRTGVRVRFCPAPGSRPPSSFGHTPRLETPRSLGAIFNEAGPAGDAGGAAPAPGLSPGPASVLGSRSSRHDRVQIARQWALPSATAHSPLVQPPGPGAAAAPSPSSLERARSASASATGDWSGAVSAAVRKQRHGGGGAWLTRARQLFVLAPRGGSSPVAVAASSGAGMGARTESLDEGMSSVASALVATRSARLRYGNERDSAAAAVLVADEAGDEAPPPAVLAVLARRPPQPPLWLRLIATLLQGGVRVAAKLRAGVSVLVHCSDGWDRTSGLTALAQLLVDPYFRTLEGACVLVQKEWVSFGHRFARRCGTGASDHDRADAGDGQRAPIFVQFVDCLWQVRRQAPPCALEWNDAFLVCLCEHAYSGCFGTFLRDSDRERAAAWAGGKMPESLWSYVLHPAMRPRFCDAAFDARRGGPPPPLVLATGPEDLAVWPYWRARFV